MPDGALIQSARARFARPVEPASGCFRRVNTILHTGSNAVLPQSCTAYAPMPRGFVTRRKHIHRTLAESRAGSGRQSPRRPVRPGARLQPARGGALWRPPAQGARTAVPVHHPPRDRPRAAQGRWRGQRPAAAPGGAGAAPAAAPYALSRGARPQRKAACGARAGPGS